MTNSWVSPRSSSERTEIWPRCLRDLTLAPLHYRGPDLFPQPDKLGRKTRYCVVFGLVRLPRLARLRTPGLRSAPATPRAPTRVSDDSLRRPIPHEHSAQPQDRTLRQRLPALCAMLLHGASLQAE